MKTDTPHVFLSYSHDSEVHKHWVRRLAEDLVKNGVRTTLDQWHLHVGDDIGAFMEGSVSMATHIVLICTETFAVKANQRKGGVGYEQAVFVGGLLANRELSSRFLPILRSGDPSKALPLYLRSRLFVDFRDDNGYSQALEQLLRRIFNAPKYIPPPLGPAPDFSATIEEGGTRFESQSPTAMVSGGARAWLLVAGTGTKELESKLKETCATLGQSLAREGYGIVTGGWPGVDELTARAFARELARGTIPLEDRLIQVVAEGRIPAFPAGSLVLVERGKEEWTESVRRAEAVLLIGGVGGTWTTGKYGLELGRAVFPWPTQEAMRPSSTCTCCATGSRIFFETWRSLGSKLSPERRHGLYLCSWNCWTSGSVWNPFDPDYRNTLHNMAL